MDIQLSGLYINDSEAFEKALFGCISENCTIKNLGIINSYVIANVTVSSIVATNIGGNIINCYNTGTVIGTDTVSGIIAYGNGNVENCYNAGTISAAVSTVGGIAGGNYGNVTKCYNSGNVSGSEYVGGIAGMNDNIVTNCYNTGTVSGKTGIGGVIGENIISAENCYNIGDVSGSENVGSVVGSSDELSLTNCFYLLDNGVENGLGTAISKDQLADQSVFENAGWDFTSVWKIDEISNKPILQDILMDNVRIVSADYNETQDGYEITPVLAQPTDDTILIAAIYDKNGVMISYNSVKTDGKTIYSLNIASNKKSSSIKLFMWNDLTSIQPVCDFKGNDIK